MVDDGSDEPIVRHVRVGHLDPCDESTGARDRLRLLGFYPDEIAAAGVFDLSLFEGGFIAEVERQKLTRAISAFQLGKKLPLTGTLDEATQTALEAEFGN